MKPCDCELPVVDDVGSGGNEEVKVVERRVGLNRLDVGFGVCWHQMENSMDAVEHTFRCHMRP